MSKVTMKEVMARLQVLEQENAALKANAAGAAAVVTKENQESTLKFLDMRKEFVVEIRDDRDKTVVAQVKFNTIVKWDTETRGVCLGSWLRIDVEKPRGADGAMVPVYGLLSSKNKKGFMYLAETKMKLEEAKQVVASC